MIGGVPPMAARTVIGHRVRVAHLESFPHVDMTRRAKRLLFRHQKRSLIGRVGIVTLEALPFRDRKVLGTFIGGRRNIVTVETYRRGILDSAGRREIGSRVVTKIAGEIGMD
jgi:hypothetical protein